MPTGWTKEAALIYRPKVVLVEVGDNQRSEITRKGERIRTGARTNFAGEKFKGWVQFWKRGAGKDMSLLFISGYMHYFGKDPT